MVSSIRDHGKFESAPVISSSAGQSEVKMPTQTAVSMGEDLVEKDQRLSGLAKKLSAAAERAAQRDSHLSRSELAELAARNMDRLNGLTYSLAKDFYDSELPDTDDEEWLERAGKANDFATGKGPNPFKGFSREQLSLIIHDESGAFTVSERRAAQAEKIAQHNEWAQYIIGKMNAEYRLTGRSDQGLREIVGFYNSLPPIEVAEFGNYQANIMMQLSTHEVEWPEFKTSLMDLLASEWGKDFLASRDSADSNKEVDHISDDNV
jgi:hypothetical protein